MSKVNMEKACFNDSWSKIKEYSKWIKNAITVN